MHQSSSTLITKKEQSNKHQITINLKYFFWLQYGEGVIILTFFFSLSSFSMLLSPAVFLLMS